MQWLPTVEESLDFEATKYLLKQNPTLQRIGQQYNAVSQNKHTTNSHTNRNRSDVSFRVIITNMLMKLMNRSGISKNVNYRNESNTC